jgi:hypothetical protein
MNDEDLRDFFAGLAMMGILSRASSFNENRVALIAYETADAMIEAKYAEEEPDVGITAIKRKYVKKEK